MFLFICQFFTYRTYTETKFNPSSSLLHGLNQPTTITSVPTRPQVSTAIRFSEYDTNAHLPPRPTSSIRPTVANSILKSSITRWPPPLSSSYYEDDNRDDQYDPRSLSSASIVDDVRRLVSWFNLSKILNQTIILFQKKNLQRMSTSDGGSK